MILCNRQLHAALDDKRLFLKPEPSPREPSVANPHCPYGEHTVDLRLSDEIVVPKDNRNLTIDLSSNGDIAQLISDNSDTHQLSANRPYVLQPNTFVLGKTYEEVGLPIDATRDKCLAARIEGKSSRARFGMLIHFTAPTVHPGWEGPLVLEIINLGHWPILLTSRMYIAQLIVEEVTGCPYRNPSQFHKQVSATGLVGNGQS